MAKKNAFTPSSTKKNQGSILSFFGKSASRKAETPSNPKTVEAKVSPVSAFRARGSTDEPDAEIAKSAPVFIPSNRRRVGSSSVRSEEVRRELFNENAGKRSLPGDGDNPFQGLSQKTKRLRRIMKVADSDDEEEDELFVPPEEEEVERVPSSQVSDDDAPLLPANDGDSLPLQSMVSGGKPVQMAKTKARDRQKVKKMLAGLSTTGELVGEEEGGWDDRHPWSTDIKDAMEHRPSEADYDKTTLFVPASCFREPKRGGMTPFQQQYWKMKMKNYDIVLFFKKGKFFELYGSDADIGHKVLGLSYTRGGRADMRCCGVPEQSFEKHSIRLIDSGYKVGRVEQTETANAAARRKASQKTKKATVCERSLVQVLTKATVTDEALLHDHRARYLLSILESDAGSADNMDDTDENAKSVTVAVCFVDCAAGEVGIREFEDDFRRSETERLFTCLRPQSIILKKSAVSKRVSKLVTWHANHYGADVIDNFDVFPAMTPRDIAKYLNPQRSGNVYKSVCNYVKASELGAMAFGAMTRYLSSLIMDVQILSLGNYDLFPSVAGSGAASIDTGGDQEMVDASDEKMNNLSSRLPEPFGESDLSPSMNRVRMDAATLISLEVLSNNADGSERNTLLAYIDRAATPAGRRLLKKWISAPLSSSEEINDRLNAVDALLKLDGTIGWGRVSTIAKQLSSGQDLARALPRLHKQAMVEDNAVMFDDTNKRKVKTFVKILRSLQSTLLAVQETRMELANIDCKSKRLTWLVEKNGGIPEEATEKLSYFLTAAFDVDAAEKTGDFIPQEGAAPDYEAKRQALSAIEQGLNDELKKWQGKLRDKKIKFYHRGKEPFQIEVSASTLDNRGTPREFQTTSESKSARRFYTKVIRDLLKDHVTASEEFEVASKSVVREIVSQFDEHYEIWSSVSKTSAELDALIGLSRASMGDGENGMCRPEVLPNDHPCPVFEAEALRHPVLAADMGRFVSNDVTLGSTSNARIAILTGPNAGGKSTLSRQVAISALLVQVGCYAPANSFKIRPFSDMFVRMGASDDVSRGLSTFMMEMEDVSNILNNASSSSLCLLDEVGRGTSTFDGYAIAYAALQYLTTKVKCISIFSTHYSSLGTDLALGCEEDRLSVGMYEMAANVDEEKKEIKFLYKFKKGVSTHSRGICCARLAGITAEVADEAEVAAEQFGTNLSDRLARAAFKNSVSALGRDAGQAVEEIRMLV